MDWCDGNWVCLKDKKKEAERPKKKVHCHVIDKLYCVNSYVQETIPETFPARTFLMTGIKLHFILYIYTFFTNRANVSNSLIFNILIYINAKVFEASNLHSDQHDLTCANLKQ